MSAVAETLTSAAPKDAATERRRDLTMAALGVLVAAIPAAALYGFTVDDALIPARYAAHIALGAGYRFNAAGPVTDGVTPLGWAYLLVPFARGGPLAALAAAKAIGVACWLAAAALVAVAIGRVSDRPVRFGGLALIAASAPLAAWSAAGLETGVVTALATLGVCLRARGHGRSGALACGIAAGLRPEVLPFAVFVALARGEARRDRRVARVILAALPFIVVACVRGMIFGRLGPLSAIAKPPDAVLGFRYAAACFLLTGPVALLAPRACLRISPFARGLLFAIAAHFIAVVLAGGDWMPLSRLVVPVLPTVALVTAHVASASSFVWATARIALALSGELFVMTRVGPVAARVGRDRASVTAELTPVLAKSQTIATVDVGWVGATTDATLLDLAGVTDPTIARLSGGHTTKRISADLLDARGVDALVLLLGEGAELEKPWTDSAFARGVEARIAGIPGIEAAFAPVMVSSRSSLHYVVLARTSPRIEAPQILVPTPFEP